MVKVGTWVDSRQDKVLGIINGIINQINREDSSDVGSHQKAVKLLARKDKLEFLTAESGANSWEKLDIKCNYPQRIGNDLEMNSMACWFYKLASYYQLNHGMDARVKWHNRITPELFITWK